MNKRKKILIIVLLIICLVVLGFLILYFTKDLRISKEEKIVRNLTSMGEEVYTELYYPSISKDSNIKSVENYLKSYEETGLKFSIAELEKYNEDFSEKIEKFKIGTKQCDKKNTMVIIYPKSPYKKTDYTLEIKMQCN